MAAACKAQGLPPIAHMPKGYRCSICALCNSVHHDISKASQEHLQAPCLCMCDKCQYARKQEGKHTTVPGESISIDLKGPFKVPSTLSSVWALQIVDYCSRWVWVDFLCSKASINTTQSFKKFAVCSMTPHALGICLEVSTPFQIQGRACSFFHRKFRLFCVYTFMCTLLYRHVYIHVYRHVYRHAYSKTTTSRHNHLFKKKVLKAP